jgi:hypothetical protein
LAHLFYAFHSALPFSVIILATLTVNFLYLQANEDEMQARYTYIQSVLKSGDDLIHSGNLGADRIVKRTEDVNSAWSNLMELSSMRRKRLLEVVEYYQVSISFRNILAGYFVQSATKYLGYFFYSYIH